MTRVLLVLAFVTVFAGCASSAPQPSAGPSASVSSTTVIPRFTARAYCFENRGIWRATAGVCEYGAP